MTSELKVDKITPASGTNTQIGESGDTTNLSAGTVTLPTSIITGQTEKTSLADADKFLISDSAASGAFKYVQKSNLPSGGLVPIAQSQSTSSTGAVNFDGCFTTTYKNYFVVISQFVPASANDVIMRFRDSSPATLTDSNYAYGGETTQNNNADEDFNYGDNQTGFQITHGVGIYANKIGATFAMHIFKPYDSATYTRFNATYGYVNSSGYLRAGSIGGAYQQNASVRGVRFEMSSGNTEAHDVRIYGIVDS
jgi:hypothetical protein